ncbi:MAG TPA: ADP compounds hydrolase NudE [Thiopseudomonas sp.]|nr:ADP compounds hydrolase NudE [Thiopseudomonas sp.]
MREKPVILTCEEVARSNIFRVEQLQLRFSNGVERTYERLRGKAGGLGAVMIVAMSDDENVLLVEEYCAGSESYEVSLPKGLIDPGEDALQAANRELQEEAGFAARSLEVIAQLSLSPGYMSQCITVVLARDLYPSRLEGDEPELMRVDTVSLRNLVGLLEHPQFTEGRALAAMYVVRDLLQQRGEFQP